MRYIQVRPGERIDAIATRVYGDPGLYVLLVQANQGLDIWNPQPGMTIEAPNVA